jgi:hypothetical protein
MEQLLLDRMLQSGLSKDRELLLAACARFDAGTAYGIIYLFSRPDLTDTSEVQIYPGYGCVKQGLADVNAEFNAGRVPYAMLVLTEPSKGREHADIFLDQAFTTPELKARASKLALQAAKPFHTAVLYA